MKTSQKFFQTISHSSEVHQTTSNLTKLSHSLYRLSEAAAPTGKCGFHSKAYGKCISNKYQSVESGICKKEFESFKKCVQDVVGKKW
ncbi:hypothetical protein PPACK8108_LOCUS20501 [Phakopsora pachyrhizi]|uniref:IMS import disulfide relay-system CHCH-CHCH-like Cx9C domain-containing protein n=1 Tax=Phakopsora pachyrhizi TaxID=170000 RepID=A0AAV0BGJ8_PHAPC|nr:hypothetical protein PPACK8108_LOCUS20501 [Phakopsora pachyrhizi]